jgi:hypothetical protein
VDAGERFWAKVDRGPHPGGCWLWTADKTAGYGRFWFNGRLARANRVAWELTHGPIPDGQWVLHRCDTPACVNPDHLFLGTHNDNVADMVAKGRHPRGDKNGSHLHPEGRARGEAHGWSKLTAQAVQEIRARIRGGASQRAVGAAFGICHQHVSKIVSGELWAHVPREG